MKFRTKTLIDLTNEYIVPILDFANIAIEPGTGLIRPLGYADNQAYTESGSKGVKKFLICCTSPEIYDYHMRNIEQTSLFNPFNFASKGKQDTYKLVKIIERIIYNIEIGDDFTDAEGYASVEKDEETIRKEMLSYIQINKQEHRIEKDLKLFSANVYDLDMQQFRTIAQVETKITDQCAILLLTSEVIKYYTDGYWLDNQKYASLESKGFHLYDRMEKLKGELDKNFEEWKAYNKELAAKIINASPKNDEDLVLDMSGEMDCSRIPDGHQDKMAKIRNRSTEDSIGDDIMLDI